MMGDQLSVVTGKWRHRLVVTTALSVLALPVIGSQADASEELPTNMSATDASRELAQASETHSFDIAPQMLADALALFGQQAGVQVSADGELVRGVETSGVSGEYQTGDALQRLLAGTGLTFRVATNGAITITGTTQGSADHNVLAPVMVEANAFADDHAGAADRANSVYVTQQDLERRNPQDIKQVFAGQSEVSVGGSLPMNQKVFVNGVEETNLAVSIDGARQSNRIFHHSGTNLIDPSLFKAARVDPGVAPADAGPGALGGSIVYETVDAKDMLAPDENLGGFAKASFDTNSGTFANDLSSYGRAGNLELLGYFKWAKGDDFEDGANKQMHGTGTDMRSALLKTAYEANGHRFELSGEQVTDDARRPRRANMQSSSGDESERIYDMQRRNFVVNYAQPDADGMFDPKASVSFSNSTLFAPVNNAASTGETENFFVKLENDFNLNENDTITAGVDFFDDVVTYTDTTLDNDEHARNFGIYGQARLQPLDPLRVSFGLRGDANSFEGIDGSEFEQEGVSGNASVAYDVTDFLTLNAGYSNAWGGVKVTQSYHLYSPDYSAGLKPARAENYVAGADVHYEGFTIGAGVFRGVFDNVRNTTSSSLTNMDDFETRGFNLRAGYDWGNGFATVSYTDSEITVNGTLPQTYNAQYLGAPLGQVLALEAAHTIEDYNLTFGGTLDVAFKNTDTEKAGGLALPSYEVVNLYTEYRPEAAEFLTVRLEVNNVFDEEYSERGTYGQDYDSVAPLREPGRSFLLQAKATF